ncbi:MAG: GNAT family N-acetyltransferase [Bacteroidales bacterium]|nr:GNAT family N-acetyltransferase [Bacteroidales bacterium]
MKHTDITDLAFRKLDFDDVKKLVRWAEEEGWNPGPHDAEVFWETDPDGFYGFYLNDQLIAGGAVISYNGAYGFMGLFIVIPEFRNRGIGRTLWYQRRDLLISRLHNDAAIGMDGVVDMQPFYRKGGFEIAFKDERYERLGEKFDLSPHIYPVMETELNELLEYDRQCFGYSRPQFLIPWMNRPGTLTFQYIENGVLKGFAVRRKAAQGYKIGPLFADNESVAEELYKACLNSVAGARIYLDIPMINRGAVELVKKYRAHYVFECARMYRGNPVQTNIHKIFGITSFELG